MASPSVEPHKSSLGLDANLVVLIAYFGGVAIGWVGGLRYLAWLVPVVIFVLEKDSRFVRFHAMQSFTLGLVGLGLAILVTLIAGTFVIAPTTGGLGVLAFLGTLTTLVSLVLLAMAVIAAVQGMQYKEYKLPIVGGIAEKLAQALEGAVHRGS